MHPEQADRLFQWLDCLHSYNTRSVRKNNLILVPRWKTNNFQKTACARSNIWNEIPEEIRMAQTLHSFKEHLKKHLAASTTGTVIMTHWFALLVEVWGMGGSHFVAVSPISRVFGGHCADGGAEGDWDQLGPSSPGR